MSIKFQCPHCQKTFQVKDEFAGKRAQCSGCKQVIVVPAPVARPADLEELAAAALKDEPVAPEADTRTVEFNCYYCDAKVQVSAELAGKQTPCPECTRIIKVPYLEKKGPKDWRKVDTRLPAGARQNMEPAPEGTWSSTSVGYVSREALVEAEAIPEVRAKLTWQQWARRGAAATVALGLVAGVALWIMNYRARNREGTALAKALEYVDAGDKLTPAAAAEVQRAAGAYYLRANRLDDARNRWHEARKALREGKNTTPVEHDLALIDLARTQLDAGGSKEETMAGVRRKWDDAINDVRQTLESLQTPEARLEAVREMARLLISRDLTRFVPSLANQIAEQSPEVLAAAGLELLQAKQQKEAEELAKQATAKMHKPQQPPRKAATPPATKAGAKPPENKPATPSVAPGLLALWLALGKTEEAARLAGPQPQKDETAIRLGSAEGAARHGQWDQARAILKETASPAVRLQMLVALAALTLDEGRTQDAAHDITEAIPLADGELAKSLSPWVFARLVRVGARAGLPADSLARVTGLISEPALRGWAQLELLRTRLQATQTPADAEWSQTVDKDATAYGIGLEEITRQRVRLGADDAMQTVSTLDPEQLRAFTYIGIALGLQDKHP
jgi:tetratricopeptide (TPR) repeat protein